MFARAYFPAHFTPTYFPGPLLGDVVLPDTERLDVGYGSYVSRQAVSHGSATTVQVRGYGAFQARQTNASGSVE